MTYELPPFGEVIKQSRLMHGLSQRELSERIGISYRQLMSLENGKSYPKYETLISLVEALHIPPENRFAARAENPETRKQNASISSF